MKHRVDNAEWKKETALIMAFFTSVPLERHSFWKRLTDEERHYLNNAFTHGSWDAPRMEKFILPGKRALAVFAICLGKKEDWTTRKGIIEVRKAVRGVRDAEYSNMAVCPDDFALSTDTMRTAELFVMQAEIAHYEFNSFKKAPPRGWFVVQEILYNSHKIKSRQLAAAIERGGVIGQSVNDARNLANTPGGDMTPRVLADKARSVGKKAGFAVKVLGEKNMEKLKMGAILAVSKGSAQEAQFIVMEYFGVAKKERPIVLIGKGITFDSGGLHIKQGSGMDDMHMDMSGGAAVIGALGAIASLKLKVNVIGLVGAVENMPSGESYRPGDLVRSMAGTTIEVVSSDAEGRVTLADALTYAEKYDPSHVIDAATLTGDCLIALGHHASALFSRDDHFAQLIERAGENVGDYVWRMPLWDEYECGLKGVFGDYLNAPKNREAGAVNAALFLYQWAKKFRLWAHVDIASTMLTAADQHLGKGASGAATALFIECVRCLASKHKT